MSDNKYKIVFKGNIKEGADQDKVEKVLSSFLHKNLADFRGQLATQKSITIKENLPHEMAKKHASALEKTGALFDIIPMEKTNPYWDGDEITTSVKAATPQKEKNKDIGEGVNLKLFLTDEKLLADEGMSWKLLADEWTAGGQAGMKLSFKIMAKQVPKEELYLISSNENDAPRLGAKICVACKKIHLLENCENCGFRGFNPVHYTHLERQGRRPHLVR